MLMRLLPTAVGHADKLLQERQRVGAAATLSTVDLPSTAPHTHPPLPEAQAGLQLVILAREVPRVRLLCLCASSYL